MHVAIESVASAREVMDRPSMDMLPSLPLLVVWVVDRFTAPPRMKIDAAASELVVVAADVFMSSNRNPLTPSMSPFRLDVLIAPGCPPPPSRTTVAIHLAGSFFKLMILLVRLG